MLEGVHRRRQTGGRARLLAVALALAVVGAGALAGCGPPPRAAATADKAAPLDVVATVYPLAQLAQYIGGPGVEVTDLAGKGAQPQGLALTPAMRSEMAKAGLVIDVGDGYQPQVEAAADKTDHVAVLPAVSKTAQPYEFWLDPNLMSKAGFAIAAAMEKASPSHKAQFANGARDFQSVASSVSSDYVSSLSTCTRTEFMTADDAFGRFAAAFGLKDLSVQSLGPKRAEALVSRDSLPAVFTEVGVGAGLLQLVAGTTGVKVKTLDPMEMAPLSGTAKANSYFAVMEKNLNALEGPLACDTTELFS